MLTQYTNRDIFHYASRIDNERIYDVLSETLARIDISEKVGIMIAFWDEDYGDVQPEGFIAVSSNTNWLKEDTLSVKHYKDRAMKLDDGIIINNPRSEECEKERMDKLLKIFSKYCGRLPEVVNVC